MAWVFRILTKIFNQKQILFRVFLVWALGLIIYRYDESQGYDLRFKLRSEQPVDQRIVIVNISKNSWDKIINPSFPSFLKSARPLSDSYFWSTPVWRKLLGTLLNEDPSLVMVDLFFDRSIPLTRQVENSFKLDDVIWRAETDERFGFKRPRFAINIIQQNSMSERSMSNVALGYIYRDYDYNARRYQQASPYNYLYDIPKKVVMEHTEKPVVHPDKPVINFRGPLGTYTTIDVTNVLNGSYPRDFFKNKIVLIGSNSMDKHFVNTPVNYLTRTEYHANVIDNLLNDLWIRTYSNLFYIMYLLAITLFCFFILYNFRQNLAVSFLILTGVSLTSLSILAFDIYNIWLPILSPLSILVLSYVILLNHLLSKSEYQAWQSQKKEESILEMNELKNNFVSLFSHDLKTPLAKIHAISDTALQLKQSVGDGQTHLDNFQKIKKEARELDRYIQSILQVTRIEAGEFNLNITPYDINDLVNECIELLRPLFIAKGIQIDFHEEPLFPVEIDVKLIKEVILNLLDNAIKYCPEGSLIEIATSDKDDDFSIEIKDNGPGIPEDEQTGIFEKFYQSKKQDTHKKGTGLGLYLVRYFVEIHHGRVDMKSSVGKGSTFIVHLPYVQEKEKG